MRVRFSIRDGERRMRMRIDVIARIGQRLIELTGSVRFRAERDAISVRSGRNVRKNARARGAH